MNQKRTAIVLSGGGARGAFQAGALRGLYELAEEAQRLDIFKNIFGVSAGAINATFLASQIDELGPATQELCDLWRSLEAESVFNTDYSSVTKNALKLVRGVSLGGFSQRLRPISVGLLNTDPLRDLLNRRLPLQRIKDNLKHGLLESVAISATDYSTSVGVTFVQSSPSKPTWKSSNRVSVNVDDLTTEHVMASSAIPIFFPPVTVDQRHYGDGCLRNTAPLSPAIHLGADELIVVGVRRTHDTENLLREGPLLEASLGRVISVLINAIFMDAVELDLERLRIINESAAQIAKMGGRSPLKTIQTLYLHPSEGLSDIACARADDLPRIIKFLLQGLGTAEEASELLSYLLFEPGYCGALVDLGYKDTMSRRDQILSFLKS